MNFPVTVTDNSRAGTTRHVTISAIRSGLLQDSALLDVVDDGADGPPPPAVETPASPFQLSSAAASLDGRVQLRFTGVLKPEYVLNAARYSVTVNDATVSVENVSYATDTICLALSPGVIRSGAQVVVTWNGLQDARGRFLRDGQSRPGGALTENNDSCDLQVLAGRTFNQTCHSSSTKDYENTSSFFLLQLSGTKLLFIQCIGSRSGSSGRRREFAARTGARPNRNLCVHKVGAGA